MDELIRFWILDFGFWIVMDDANMSEEIKKHPLNVQGRHYVDYDVCLDHECCVDEAPNNFKMDRNTWGAYIFKQPETLRRRNSM